MFETEVTMKEMSERIVHFNWEYQGKVCHPRAIFMSHPTGELAHIIDMYAKIFYFPLETTFKFGDW